MANTLFGQPASPTGSPGGAGATAASYGVQFSVSAAARCDGLWFYTLPGSPGPLPSSIAVYDTGGNLVTLASPSWSGAAGSGWVFAAFPAPPALNPGTNYKAVIYQPFITPNWNQTDSTYWSSGAGASGITSGILSAPGNATAVNGQDSTVTGATLGYPTTSMAGANIWLDVQVSAYPANTYTVLKQQPVTVPPTNDNGTYTMGMQFQVLLPSFANAVWFYSPPGSPELPETIGIYNQAFSSLVHSETATWSGPVGSGWVRAAFASPVPLNFTTNYKAVILKNGGSNGWYAGYAHYWDTTGPGASGITNGPLSAPNSAGAANGDPGGGGQNVFNVGATLQYPNQSFNANNYWVDVEISLVVAYAAYACNEGGGSTIIDYSGNSRNMTVLGSNTWPAGHGAYAASFQAGTTGSDGAQWDGGTFLSALSGDVTAMTWYKITAGPTATSFAAGLYGSSGFSRTALFAYRSLSGVSASPQITARDTTGATVYSFGNNGTTVDGNWHHVAVVWHAAGNFDMYIDGVLFGTQNTSGNPIGANVRYLGAGSILSNTGAQAQIQDFRVYANALAASDIVALMNTPVTSGGTNPSFADVGGAVDLIALSAAVPLTEAGGAVDVLSVSASVSMADVAGAIDLLTVGIIKPPVTDVAGAIDSIVTSIIVLAYDTYFTAEPAPPMWHAENAGAKWQSSPAAGRPSTTGAGSPQ